MGGLATYLSQKESFQLHLEWGEDIEDRGRSREDVAAAAMLFPRHAFITSTNVIWHLTCKPQSPGIAELRYVSNSDV